MSESLRDYIRKSFAQGLKKNQIQANLLGAGWKKESIDQAFEDVEFSQKEFIEQHRKTILPSKKFLSGILRVTLAIILIGSIVAVIYFGIRYFTRPKPSLIANLKIDGDADCVAKTNEALRLLREKVPDEYSNVAKYITLIKCDQFAPHPLFEGKGGQDFKEFRVDLKTVDAGPIWYAGAIVHESCHARQFQEWKAIKASLSPEELEREKNRDLEKECYEASYGALKKLDADQRTLDYAKNLY